MMAAELFESVGRREQYCYVFFNGEAQLEQVAEGFLAEGLAPDMRQLRSPPSRAMLLQV